MPSSVTPFKYRYISLFFSFRVKDVENKKGLRNRDMFESLNLNDIPCTCLSNYFHLIAELIFDLLCCRRYVGIVFCLLFENLRSLYVHADCRWIRSGYLSLTKLFTYWRLNIVLGFFDSFAGLRVIFFLFYK